MRLTRILTACQKGDNVQHIDVLIIGTGTAALAAASEVRKVTDSFRIISNGVTGTTCARTGCMPAVTFIEASLLYHQRHKWQRCGIHSKEDCSINMQEMLIFIRNQREHFLTYAHKQTDSYREHLVEGDVWFLSPSDVKVNDDIYRARRVVLATGSSPIIPSYCHGFEDFILTSDTLFEQETLPASIGVLGLDMLGTEMAQAFSRLGIKVTAVYEGALIGGLSDRVINAYAALTLAEEMTLNLNQKPILRRGGDRLILNDMPVEKLFVAMDRKANLENMGLEACGVILPGQPVMDFDPHTMQVRDLPIFVAGDVKPGRSLLHNAADEGRIAGYNAARRGITHFQRRTGLQITHSCPTMAVAGMPWENLPPDAYVIGEASYENQGRAVMSGTAQGLIHIYVSKASGILLGAEMFAPEGEHLAHMLAWLIDREVTVNDALHFPFYHPSIEEGLRTALENAAEKLGHKSVDINLYESSYD